MSGPRRVPLRLEVRVDATPRPTLLRAAIVSRLQGRTFATGPEDEVARAVERAVAEARGDTRWR